MATRKTHVVRCPADPDNPEALYVDVEVLDALGFIGPNGKEMILRFKQADIDPVIVDDVGSGSGRSSAKGTRRSHMERVSDDKTKIAIEVLDNVAFIGPNGQEWILNLPSRNAAERNTTKGTGGSTSTRSTHDEKVSQDFSKSPSQYLTVTRTDEVTFRTINGEEMVIKMPSNDDPNSSDPRADTDMTPAGYDPTNANGPKPPINADKNPYVVFPDNPDASCINTQDAKISQGPLWWIRKVSGLEILVIKIDIQRTVEATVLGMDSNFSLGGVPDEVALSDIMPANGSAPEKTAGVQVWGTPNTNTGKALGWTALFFLNVAQISSDLKAAGNAGDIEVNISIPALTKKPKNPNDGQGVGNYIWAVSGGDEFVYIPIHPAPDATNAFEPYPFDDVESPGTYIALWNTFYPGTYANLVFLCEGYGIPVPDITPPEVWGGLGAPTSGEAATLAATLNAIGEAQYAQAVEEHELFAEKYGVDLGPVTPPTIYEALIIDFGSGPPTKPDDNPTVSVTVTAWDYVGRSSFPYTAQNQPSFPAATKTAATTVALVSPSDAVTLHVRLSARGDLTVTR